LNESSPSAEMQRAPLRESKALLWLVMAIVMMNSGYTLTIIYPVWIPITLILLSSLLIPIAYFNPPKPNSSALLILSMAVLTVLGFIANASYSESTNWKDYISFLLLLLGSYLVSRVFSFNEIVKKFLFLMRIICLAAIFGFLVVNVFEAEGLLKTVKSVKELYYNGFLFLVLDKAPFRLTGIFWEPGVFQSYLYFGLLLELFYLQVKSRTDIILFFICAIWTMSTTAFFLLPIFGLLILAEKHKRPTFLFFLFLYLLAIILYWINFDLITNQLAEWFPIVFYKMLTENDSVIARQYSVIADFRLFWANPFWGVGRQNLESQAQLIYRQMGVFIDSRMSTVTAFLASMGLPFTLLYLAGIFRSWPKLVKLKRSKVLIIVIILTIITTEPFMHSMFFFIVFFALFDGGAIKEINPSPESKISSNGPTASLQNITTGSSSPVQLEAE